MKILHTHYPEASILIYSNIIIYLAKTSDLILRMMLAY